jgi:hypothetical protein
MEGYYINKELWEKIDKLIADHKRELAERVEKLLERCESYDSIDDILIKKYHYTQEEIDNYRFPYDRTKIDAAIERFLNTEF